MPDFRVILDAGHGGAEPGAMFEGRREKDDTLRLALAVGQILTDNGVDVEYTRTEDVYNTPFEKAQIANREGGDFLISFHRNSSPRANQYSGVESLVYDLSGEKVAMAENINQALERVGFRNLGVNARPGLVILRRTRMPAVLVEAGFLNTDVDNELFDERFDEIAQAIADAILQTLGQDPDLVMESYEDADSRVIAGRDSREDWLQDDMQRDMRMPDRRSDTGMPDVEENDDGFMQYSAEESAGRRMQDGSGRCCCAGRPVLYRVQTGAFRNRKYAEDQLYRLLQQNYPAYILREDNFFKVQVGAFRQLDNAVRMEKALRKSGYPTYITT